MVNQQKQNSLINLIKEYISCSDYFLSLYINHFPLDETDIIADRKTKGYPKEGEIEGVEYYFHGGGVNFSNRHDEIDIDFGPNGRHDGFDLMRLKHFLNARRDKYSEFIDITSLESTFLTLVSIGKIQNQNWFPGENLFYLDDAIKR